MRIAFLYNCAAEDPAQFAEDDDPARSPVVAALRRLGHEVTPLACTLDLASVRRNVEQAEPDLAFNRVESLGGSDAMAAAVAMLLDAMHVPYSGCHAETLVAAVNKVSVKEQLIRAGLPTPEWITDDLGSRRPIDARDCTVDLCNQRFADQFPQFILKSVYEHASYQMDDAAIIHATSVDEIAQLVRNRSGIYGKPFFAERFIDGREFNLSLLGDAPDVLPPAEIDFSAFPAEKPRIVGFGAKWTETSFEFQSTPRRFSFSASDGPLIRTLEELAVECWRLFGLRGYARIDFRVDASGQPWILEVNTNPCLAPTSGFAAALNQAGLGYDDGIRRIIQAALPNPAASPQPMSITCRQPRAATLHRSRVMNSITLRDDVSPNDRAVVRSIVERTGFFRPDEVAVAVELVDEHLSRSAVSGYHFLFAVLGDDVAGYACYGPIACTVASFDLYWIAVDPTFQRHGIGGQLMAAVESRVRQAGGQRIYIDTSSKPQYAPTRAFYERCGFQCEANLTDFYAPQDNRMIFAKLVTKT